MTRLEDWLSRACNALGLQADIPFVANIENEHGVRAVARIHNLGANNGMLVVRSYEDVRPHAKELAKAGYGYSVLDEPRSDEAFDLDTFKEMFLDWGWMGPETERPRGLQ